MEAVAHGMKPRKPGLTRSVAKDFIEADKSAGKFVAKPQKLGDHFGR